MARPLFWIHSNNFGDALNPYLYRWMTKESAVPSADENETGKIVACGSVAHVALPGDIVWGTGVMPGQPLKWDNTTDVRAMRGPYSGEIFEKHTHKKVAIYGDPALLISRYYAVNVAKTQEVGIVPHYIDKDIVLDDPVLRPYYIDIMMGVEEFIRKINMCKYVVSSALHGLICAEAYNIPAVWCEFSDNVAGKGFKFHDYYLGTNRTTYQPLDWRWGRRNIQDAKDLALQWLPPEYWAEGLLNSCPFYEE